MRNGVESLKKKFPGFDNYLANKRVYVFGSHAIIRHKDRFIEPQSGQLLFEFDLDLAEEVEHRIKRFESEKTAEGFKKDCGMTPATYPLALEAYQKAVNSIRTSGDAYVNMGNITTVRLIFG